ncbi:MAG: hypothetical protein COV59_02670 [Candidatus Magasanikbacteria bacterium CG11_big_fil_rev_8_21_14_0_20_39_34]|uniref:Uncharacterized protein n=1 Tax=Candidatus Magasanikbacteria bacterium CG11_big_fil_rev_8_21_14_0_20_39_34 TaxID=1974653 RepID=A0A2H0N595_9BACT|nr:MAG: hypothetical protein COV59_02670 [Candidatus Magasanikbacteria bacterium CG11_big_fil_rev_8_21_14_0_20_39_34]
MNKSVSLVIAVMVCLWLIPKSYVQASGIADGTLITSPKHSSVYLVEGGKRRPFINESIYKTWYSNFKSVKTVSVEDVEAIELGDPMPIKSGTKLLKFPLNPKIYAVTKDSYIQHIPDVYTAQMLFGANWGNEIIEIPEVYYLFYEKGPALPSRMPNQTSGGELSQAVCPGRPGYTKYTRIYDDAWYGDSYGNYELCLPSRIVLELSQGNQITLLSGHVEGEQFDNVFAAQTVDNMHTREQFIEMRRDPFYGNINVQVTPINADWTLVSHQYTRPGGAQSIAIEVIDDIVSTANPDQNMTRVFNLTFDSDHIADHMDTINEARQALLDTFHFLD